VFLSHFTKAFDAKGRLTLPAPFRALLTAEGFAGVFVHPALDAPALDCGGGKLIAEIGAMLAKMPPYAPEREDLSLALLGTSEIVKLDPEGRFVLSDRLKGAIGLTHEATFVGQGDKFQIWAADAFVARLESARSRARTLRADLARAT
jgi:MraZ protein